MSEWPSRFADDSDRHAAGEQTDGEQVAQPVEAARALEPGRLDGVGKELIFERLAQRLLDLLALGDLLSEPASVLWRQ